MLPSFFVFLFVPHLKWGQLLSLLCTCNIGTDIVSVHTSHQRMNSFSKQFKFLFLTESKMWPSPMWEDCGRLMINYVISKRNIMSCRSRTILEYWGFLSFWSNCIMQSRFFSGHVWETPSMHVYYTNHKLNAYFVQMFCIRYSPTIYFNSYLLLKLHK